MKHNLLIAKIWGGLAAPQAKTIQKVFNLIHQHKHMSRITTTTLAAILLVLFSCNDKNEDITEDVNRKGAVESSMSVEHIDSLHDLLITKHTVWHNGAVARVFEHRDTVPALGDTLTEAENNEGDTKQILVKKDYEIFITIK